MSVPSQGDTIETKTIQPHHFHPFDSYLPHFTRFDSIEDIKLQIPGRFPIQRPDSLQRVDVHKCAIVTVTAVELAIGGISRGSTLKVSEVSILFTLTGWLTDIHITPRQNP